MQTIILYRTIHDNGVVTISPVKPDKYDSTCYRLVADEGKELVKDDIRTGVVDTDSVDGWEEEDIIVDETNVYTPDVTGWEVQE